MSSLLEYQWQQAAWVRLNNLKIGDCVIPICADSDGGAYGMDIIVNDMQADVGLVGKVEAIDAFIKVSAVNTNFRHDGWNWPFYCLVKVEDKDDSNSR